MPEAPESSPATAPADDVTCLLLAAGVSRRMGTAKLLLTLDGKSLLRRAAETACAVCRHVAVVLGREPERHAAALDGLPVEIVVNADYETGMSSSIRAGLAAAVRWRPEGVLILLADQPAVTPAFLRSLLEAFRSGRVGPDDAPPLVAASRYPGTVGPPVIFSRRVFAELQRIEGEGGAKAVIAAHERDAVFADLDDAAVDVDTPEDLEQWRSFERDPEGLR